MPGHEALETVTFEEHGCKTRLTDKLFFQTVEDRDGMFESGIETGVTETMDRFAEPLKEMQKESAMTKTSSSTEREITVTRIFDAPRELVWKAWRPTARGNMRQGWNESFDKLGETLR